MRQADFLSELQRLFRASKNEGDLTPERIAVWWEQYQHEPLPRWKRAVSISIGESTAKPSQSRMEKALQQAEDEEQREKIADNRGGGFGNVYQAAIRSTATTPEFHNAIRRTMEGAITGYSPSECADWLEADALFDPSTDFSLWIEAMRSSPDDWRGVPIRARDGGALVR